ncbi:MAG: hypothetical protein KBC84_11465 [Proteobacteria bacterium]|nr:hypothetical protein [Pseudomonadota bacterium]
MTVQNQGQLSLELCLAPDKPDPLSFPTPINSLFTTTTALIRVGQDEACKVTYEEKDSCLIISAQEPAKIFLTPNLSQFPGFSSKHIKLAQQADGHFQTYHSRDRSHWEPWVANQERK